MNNLSDVVDTLISVAGLAAMGLFLAAMVYYFELRPRRLASKTWAQRNAWVSSHFPEPEYVREDMGISQFVAALLEDTEDATVWQYYDKIGEARKVEGGYNKLCSLDCSGREYSDPELLFLVTGNKVKIALDQYAVRVVLRIVLQYQKVRYWIQKQSQYAGFSLETVSLDEMNAILSAPGISLWGYVPAWEDAALIPSEKYDSINDATYYTIFAIDMEAKRIYQPVLELTQDGE